MWGLRTASVLRAVAVAGVFLLASSCGTARDDGPALLAELLRAMPAAHLDDHLYFTDLRVDEPGFGTTLPLSAVAALGVGIENLTGVLESGGDPTTLIAGDVDGDAVAQAAREAGYDLDEHEGWTVFRREGAAGPGAPAVLSAVPAGAARRGLLALGGTEAITRVVGQHQPAAEVDWVRRIVDGLGESTSSVVLSPPLDGEQAARAAEVDVARLLEREGIERRLEGYEGVALAWARSGDDGRGGAVVLALRPGVDPAEQAAALTMRAATGPVLGERRRSMSDLLAVGAPRFDEDARVVNLPVRWGATDPEVVRSPLEGGGLLFLVPGP